MQRFTVIQYPHSMSIITITVGYNRTGGPNWELIKQLIYYYEINDCQLLLTDRLSLSPRTSLTVSATSHTLAPPLPLSLTPPLPLLAVTPLPLPPPVSS